MLCRHRFQVKPDFRFGRDVLLLIFLTTDYTDFTDWIFMKPNVSTEGLVLKLTT